MTTKRYPAEITLCRIDAELFLADIDDLAEAVWLCGAAVDRAGINPERAFLALQKAILDRTDAFRREHGLPVDREPASVGGTPPGDARN
ncbi:MAG TPA: hypothetical protein VNS22_17985 [Geminicoccus sp.]|uniref:hypothetical protein n=1 Tax=Geminicoccus sp. TaxID=2024832 RepID=UPI002C195D5C|nr:hypothetical protein [Geminicoccus sp.]HWL70252.1 hypothetical protein [Geminicoccus sp.]